MAKRRHVWLSYEASTLGGKVTRYYCTMCGKDRTTETLKVACRPTTLPGL